jgi:hypothetical protein
MVFNKLDRKNSMIAWSNGNVRLKTKSRLVLQNAGLTVKKSAIVNSWLKRSERMKNAEKQKSAAKWKNGSAMRTRKGQNLTQVHRNSVSAKKKLSERCKNVNRLFHRNLKKNWHLLKLPIPRNGVVVGNEQSVPQLRAW